MSRKRGILKITLKSDLCVASGYSHEGMVDVDVCYNNNGIPFIAGRRLKGCLKAAGELIGLDNINELFGEGGNSGVRGIIVGNAVPENTDKLNKELSRLKAGKNEFAAYLTRQKVLEQFTRIKAQTEIDDNGVAKTNSLRYIRVVNQYSPFTGQELNFFADIEFDCDKETVERLALALRNIGMDRNRGLGSVRCELIRVETIEAVKTAHTASDDTLIKLDYVIQNVQPLMMSSGADSRTERYISGQSVLGFLAGRYLAHEGNSAEDELFKDMFIRGEVKFSNLYISDYEKDKIYKYNPAPSFVNRLKKTKVFVNVAKPKDIISDKYNEAGGNQPKKLKGQFVYFDETGKIAVKEPEIEIVYHHSKARVYEDSRNQKNEKDGILYSLEVLEEGQFFAGSIVAKKKYTDILKALMENGSFRFGKSKSAQYGECRLVSDIKEERYTYKEELKAGEKVLAVLESDGIFYSDNGCYTTRAEDVKKAVAGALGIEYEDTEENVFLQSKSVYGYNTLWNLKKPDYPAIAAGSAIEYTVSKDCSVTTEYVGTKQLEGYGKVKLYHMDKMQYAIEEAAVSGTEACELKEAKDILIKILFEKLLDSIRAGVYDIGRQNLKSSKIGRLTLMLNEAISQGEDKAYSDFISRVDSMKDKTEKTIIHTFLKKYICEDDFTLSVQKLLSKGDKPNEEAQGYYDMLRKLNVPSLDEKVKSFWKRYMMDILVCQKYLN